MKELKRRKHHSKEFRTQAVELLLTGKSLRELAPDLGISHVTLNRWKEEYLLEKENLPEDPRSFPSLKAQAEYKRIREENDKLRLHNEILKKALGILSEQPPKSMP